MHVFVMGNGGGGEGKGLVSFDKLLINQFRKKVLHEIKQSAIKDVYYEPSNL